LKYPKEKIKENKMSIDNLNNPFSSPSNDGSTTAPQAEPSVDAQEYEMFLRLMQKFGGAVSGADVAPNQVPQPQANPAQVYAEQQIAMQQYQQQAMAAQAGQQMMGGGIPQNFQQFRQAQAAIPQKDMGRVGAFSVQANESLIIQNALEGPLFIADLNLTLAPFEPWDLGYNQEARYSRDLSKCFQYGFIKVLTEDEYYMALQHESYQSMVEDQEREMKMVQKNDMDLYFEAEHIDLTGDQGSGRQEFKKSAPNMNNPFLRGAHYMQAQVQGQYQGQPQAMDPALYHQQMSQQANSRQGKKVSVADVYDPFSGNTGRATVMQAPTGNNRGAQAQNVQMGNFNNNARANVPAQFVPGQPANQQYASVNPFLQQQQRMGYPTGDTVAAPVDLSNDSYNDNSFGDFDDFGGGGSGPSGITRMQ
jgi:hypothetical protein